MLAFSVQKYTFLATLRVSLMTEKLCGKVQKGVGRMGWGGGMLGKKTFKCLIFNKCVNFTYRGKWVFIEELVNFLREK